MEPEIEAICKQMSKDRFQRLLEDMQGMQGELFEPEVDISNQNKTNMASYSEVLSNTNTNKNKTVGADNVTGESSDPSDYIKPIFLTDTDVFGSVKPPRPLWLTNIEIYNAIDTKIPAERIKGIRRIRDMWRIYMDNEEDKLSLLVTGMNLRGRQVPLHSQNPRKPGNLQPDTIRITVKNVPISADDGQIHRALTLQGCDIQGLHRKRLRVKGKVTNCQTGDRIIISKLLDKPIAKSLQIGKYMAIVMHSGQPEFENRSSNIDGNTKPCYKCLQVGHFVYDCPNDWVCRKCKLPGHKMMDCPNAFQVVGNIEEQIVTTDEPENDSQSNKQAEKLKPKTNVTNKPKGRNPKTTDANPNNVNKPNPTKPGKEKTSVNETNSSNSDKTQSYIDKFMNTPQSQRRNLSQHHTPPTPPENLHDKTTGNNGPKKAKAI
ncbi:Hypothetical predicted protein [Mytilus galloprovincialis]|uniref:CCHC-type domain-containing protein n=1 Tax=Mytilus galloprovincialis TaxID=29158 RepID=A0A8B6GE66_MYTGA|nr:Hypothetical predicted protein [Mytilus galloprovincialis]